MSTITGTTRTADHTGTFKVTKYIRDETAKRVYGAVLTIMNEYCQIVAQYMVETKSWLEVAPALQFLVDRYEHLGDGRDGHWRTALCNYV